MTRNFNRVQRVTKQKSQICSLFLVCRPDTTTTTTTNASTANDKAPPTPNASASASAKKSKKKGGGDAKRHAASAQKKRLTAAQKLVDEVRHHYQGAFRPIAIRSARSFLLCLLVLSSCMSQISVPTVRSSRLRVCRTSRYLFFCDDRSFF